MEKILIEKAKAFVQDSLKHAEGGHDWFHVLRVYRNALLIAEKEAVDTTTVALGALLHDIADPKFHDGDETLGPRLAREFLQEQNAPGELIEEVIYIIQHCSFGGGFQKAKKPSLALQIIQDADRLDALGAIGIARTFNYGGFKNRALYDPSIPPQQYATKSAYRNSKAPTINHFYEKLLLLKDEMHTTTAKKIAEERHAFMETFLEQFYAEWEGKK
ncbi:HD domain-containing protein [Croceiramulus getboli]|nr:HD domain-containing protein [Flavobacteriaceae bacterium YJPT1-3]